MRWHVDVYGGEQVSQKAFSPRTYSGLLTVIWQVPVVVVVVLVVEQVHRPAEGHLHPRIVRVLRARRVSALILSIRALYRTHAHQPVSVGGRAEPALNDNSRSSLRESADWRLYTLSKLTR